MLKRFIYSRNSIFFLSLLSIFYIPLFRGQFYVNFLCTRKIFAIFLWYYYQFIIMWFWRYCKILFYWKYTNKTEASPTICLLIQTNHKAFLVIYLFGPCEFCSFILQCWDWDRRNVCISYNLYHSIWNWFALMVWLKIQFE